MEELKDVRFSHISTDPRFRKTPESVRKVKIDKRFQSLFTDKRFQVKYSVDKRGRPVDQSSSENFKKYYEISEDDESSDEEDEEAEGNKEGLQPKVSVKNETKNKLIENDKLSTTSNFSKKNSWHITQSSELHKKNDNGTDVPLNSKDETKVNKRLKSKKNSGIDLVTDEIEKARMTDEIKMKLRNPTIDYARGVGTLISDSSSEEESSEDSETEDDADHGWGELDRGTETTEEATDRLAILHMDWDRIRAVDLIVLLNSFLPPEGVISSVTIYPSQFGMERMKEEEEKGPMELVNLKVEDDQEIDEESKEGKRYHMERLRQYQLNRLKYFYAVVKFDSAETANKVYTECDGLEYESSATKLDLRFVPEEETFDQEPREVCTSMPDPAKYEPRIFTNTALQQGKVELTWDETDPQRQEFTKKILKNTDKIDNSDLQAYLAYSSEEENDRNNEGSKSSEADSENDQKDEPKEEDKIAKYKSLLASLEEEEEKKKNRDVDLEITWGVGLKEKAEKSVKEKLKTPQTPFEEMLGKFRQKKKLKKDKKTQLKEKEKGSDSEDDLYSDDDIPLDVDMSDPYFKEELQGSKLKKKKKTVTYEEIEEIKQRKAELELLLLEENDSEKQKSHFNIKTIQEQEKVGKKKKRRKQLKKKPQAILPDKDDFEVDVADDRFSALYTSHHFNIDPAEPQFRKTKAMETIISEKLKRRKQEHQHELPSAKLTKMDPELSLLVKSIKSKTKQKLWN